MFEIVKRVMIEGDMPFDKSFDGGFALCHCTGHEVCDMDGEWWIEYRDPMTGELYYGR